MKKNVLLLIFVVVGIALFANVNSINLSQSRTELELLRSDDNGLQMKLNLNEISAFDVTTNEGNFSQINIESFTHSTFIGAPKLPIIKWNLQFDGFDFVTVTIVVCSSTSALEANSSFSVSSFCLTFFSAK